MRALRVVEHETFWNTPVTAEALRREIERMTRGTLMPERLRALYSALGEDPLLIQECLARPTLVARLSASFFSSDRRIHAAARREAERLASDLREGRIDPHADDPRRMVVDVVQESPAEFERQRARFPMQTGDVARRLGHAAVVALPRPTTVLYNHPKIAAHTSPSTKPHRVTTITEPKPLGPL